jgi:LacI family transcriptional regulator
MKPTITDIAKDTGLSLATISKYLNHKSIRPENARLIEESIQRFGYTPNRIAQGLRSKKTNTIAMIIPSLGDCLWGNIILPIECYLREKGYTSVVCTNFQDSSTPGGLPNFLLHNQIDGIIAIDVLLNQKLFSLFREKRIPVVCVDGAYPRPAADLVSSTNYQSSFEAGVHFIRSGHTRIGFIAGSQNSYTTVERTNGFLEALRQGGLTIHPEYCLFGDGTSAAAQKLVRQVLALPNPPTALFFLNYASFLGGFMEIMRQNIRIPQDLSVISFDNDKVFDTLRPKITVIQQDFSAIALQCAQLLLQRLSGDDHGFPECRLVPTSFLCGESVLQLQKSSP